MMVQLLLRHKNNAISKEDWDSFLRLEHHIYDLENGARNGKDYCTQTLQNVQLLARAGEAYSGSSENPGYVELLAGRVGYLRTQSYNLLTLISSLRTL